MMNKKRAIPNESRPLTAVELARYLKRMSAIHKDAQTGNRQLSEALQELSTFLAASNAKTVELALSGVQKQTEMDLPLEPNPHDQDISLEEIPKLLERDSTTRAELVLLGGKRFGIPESKLKKLSREAVVKTIRAALEHEQSIEILSDEASKGGRNRTS